MLESYIRKQLKKKEILLMTHIVLGYPSFEESYRLVEKMVESGVDLMELQIPFSEPTADGPVIVQANQDALSKGSTVKDCFYFTQKLSNAFDIPFLIMSYYNILFKFGLELFISTISDMKLHGAIVPDLPPEEGNTYLKVMHDRNLSPILLFSPTTSIERMKYLASFGSGFIYCVARKGVTGQKTDFSEELSSYLERCRKATSLPLAVGFGVKEKKDIDFLKGKAEIAVIGSETIRIVEREGVDSVGAFIKNLH